MNQFNITRTSREAQIESVFSETVRPTNIGTKPT